MQDPTQRFSERVENYARYRPSYPRGLPRLLERECGLAPGVTVADVGSGTGILSSLLLESGARVYGVEPNGAMREAGEKHLSGHDRFTSVAGTAERTTLRDGGVDLVTAGQSFHWFDREETRREFARILAPGGSVALVWNSPRYTATPFMRAYRNILERFGTDWERVANARMDSGYLTSLREYLSPFFGGAFEEQRLENRQILDREALQGRLLSSSYVPGPEDEESGPMLAELAEVFDRHQSGLSVVFEYDTRVFYGRLS